MEQLYRDLLDRLTTEIIEFNHFDESPEVTSENIKTCLKLNEELKQRYLQASHTTEEQIVFFKTIKPRFYSELLLQTTIRKFLVNKPTGPVKEIKAFIHKNQERSYAPFYEFPAFRNYMRVKSTKMDDYLFTQGPYDPEESMDLEISNETDFSSPADTTLSILLAAERFQEFLNQISAALKRSKTTVIRELPKPLKYKGPKINLIMTSYALSDHPDIEGDVKAHAEWFELMYDEDLGDVYNNFQDVKKKKNPTAFFDNLKNAVFQRINRKK